MSTFPDIRLLNAVDSNRTARKSRPSFVLPSPCKIGGRMGKISKWMEQVQPSTQFLIYAAAWVGKLKLWWLKSSCWE